MKKILVPLNYWYPSKTSSLFKCSVCEHYVDRNGDVALPRDYTEYELNTAPSVICSICEEQRREEKNNGM